MSLSTLSRFGPILSRYSLANRSSFLARELASGICRGEQHEQGQPTVGGTLRCPKSGSRNDSRKCNFLSCGTVASPPDLWANRSFNVDSTHGTRWLGTQNQIPITSSQSKTMHSHAYHESFHNFLPLPSGLMRIRATVRCAGMETTHSRSTFISPDNRYQRIHMEITVSPESPPVTRLNNGAQRRGQLDTMANSTHQLLTDFAWNGRAIVSIGTWVSVSSVAMGQLKSAVTALK